MLSFSDKASGRIQLAFNAVFISVLTIQLIVKAVQCLPEKWLFLLTSDAMEYFLFGGIAYFLFFAFRKMPLSTKISAGALSLFVLLGLVVLKTFRIEGELFTDRSFDFLSEFIGKTVLFYTLVFIANRITFFSRINRLEEELQASREMLLKAQLQPHFLFNAFNSLYSMALHQHPKTPDMVLKLSGMMRYLTDDSIHTFVKLQQEITFLEEYLSWEKTRFGEDGRIRWKVQGDPNGISIAPLLLMTLVENAFKHGFYTNSKDSFVDLSLKIDKSCILFTIKNSIQSTQHFSPSSRKGIGLEKLRKRLELVYPNHHHLSIDEAGDTFVSKLEIQLEK